MQGRFKMEYRLFTIVRYITIIEITTHLLNLTCMQGCKGRQVLILIKLPGGGKTARKFFKNFKAGDRREGRKLRKGEAKQEQRQE
jgi:hypothetical protein